MFLGVDLLKFDMDKPLPRDLPVPGVRGTFQRHLSMLEGTTLRGWARDGGLYETYKICGTPDHVADVLEHTVEYNGCDGFHFRPAGGLTDIKYLLEVSAKLIPVLQRRGWCATTTGADIAGSFVRILKLACRGLGEREVLQQA